MAKNKDVRVTITLECINCAQNNEKKKLGVSRYTTQKNRRNTPIRLELKKFCYYCNKHTIHKEIKK
uniref:Large ribosomal subunit protein bL33c n=5 Tax=Orthotrichaceae TaxID=52989 RepID=A0A0F6PZA6_9BRYO|nr:ribosomal protein L33 [Orthotrichum rogeri]YP_009136229.1 ribosomal protein L33 [Orthotrichum obtusifolium]YP_009629003.1 ribosomal protein L33 [Lewinskya incana]YP_009645920.1 ribosomal protein L33 [Stoneobryum bunyaense]YP_009646002.1 ribosomal protein L33 [Ulota bruchii]YP_010188914.1 ribosomal protein L33 [Orthotrichum stellatum]YP_010189075.1 ribosomal protein L33 [Ulota hutchinsiae]AJD22483.1 ribosomal protein L33 [Orthotrichum rogeri]AKC99481.1 ribosomal protein L33 [Orthotrichum 